MSGMPQATGTPALSPSRLAGSGSSRPWIEPVGTSSGSNELFRSLRLMSSLLYPSGAPMWLSVSQEAVIDAGVATALPVIRNAK